MIAVIIGQQDSGLALQRHHRPPSTGISTTTTVPAPGRAAQLEAPTQDLHTFAHAHEAKARAHRFIRDHPDAIVADRQAPGIGGAVQADLHFARLRMARDIGQCFLQDAKQTRSPPRRPGAVRARTS